MTDSSQITQASLMNVLPVGIGVLIRGENGFEFQNANVLLRKMLGIESAASLYELMSASNSDLINELAMTAGGEVTIEHENRWYNFTISSFENNEWLAVVKDVTSIKSETTQARAETEEKSHFLAMMSHEVRTPMQSIFGLLELIKDETGLSTSTRSMVDTAHTSATGLLSILDDVLDIAKFDAGKMSLEPLEVPLRTLCYGIIECLEVGLHGNRVNLKVEIQPNIPPVIVTDPKRLRQVLINLIGNAIKFTEAGNVTLRVSTETTFISAKTKADIPLRFEVIDTGLGMPEDVAARIFQSFEQGMHKKNLGGTGLGLSICEKIIMLLDGRIGVKSAPGKGSTFWFEINVGEVDKENAQELPDLSGLLILSVEDHPKGAQEIVRTLNLMGADVISVPTYAEGLEMINTKRFNVALIDQGLPDGLGINLLKHLSKTNPDTGMIMYTVRNDHGLRHSTKTIGATYLEKPASRLGLGKTVKHVHDLTHKHRKHKGPTRILIAEDNASIKDVLARQFHKLGVEADFVENGMHALKILEEGKHGLLITDLNMADMDGREVIKRLRAMETDKGLPPHEAFPVIALTADIQMAERQVYLSYGFNECLLKPISIGQIKQLLIRWGILKAEETTTQTNSTASNTTPVDDQIDIVFD